MLINGIEFKIGADPELFVTDNTGKFVSAHGMVNGTKEKPHVVDNGAVQVDGMALEFNIDPATNQDEFLANINSVMSQLAQMVPEYNLNAVPIAEFGKKVMDEAPDEAKELGCDPDFNAWTGGNVNTKPNGEVSFRTGAGHIHIGWTEGMDIDDPGHKEACMMLVKQLDYYLGMPSLFFDDSTKRRELYGAAGAFRVKPYGVEYRVLSNAWLKDERLIKWVYDNTKKAIKGMFNGAYAYNSLGNVARTCIDCSRKARSREVMNALQIPMPPLVEN
jgi:hypothetical protein